MTWPSCNPQQTLILAQRGTQTTLPRVVGLDFEKARHQVLVRSFACKRQKRFRESSEAYRLSHVTRGFLPVLRFHWVLWPPVRHSFPKLIDYSGHSSWQCWLSRACRERRTRGTMRVGPTWLRQLRAAKGVGHTCTWQLYASGMTISGELGQRRPLPGLHWC